MPTVIHDDQAHQGVNCGYANGPTCGYHANEGYGDGLNCYITLQAGRDEQVELSFTQMYVSCTCTHHWKLAVFHLAIKAMPQHSCI